MRRRAHLVIAVTLALAAGLVTGCASKRPAELVPPRLDLSRYETLGIVEFAATGAKGLGASATREFLASVHDAQPGTPVLEIGSASRAFGHAGADPDPEAIRALAERTKVQAVIIGRIAEEKSTPRVRLAPSWGSASASAQLVASLDVRILDGATGATVWSSSSRREIPIAGIDLSTAGVSRLDANPIEEARATLVRDLAYDVTFDLRPRWVQR